MGAYRGAYSFIMPTEAHAWATEADLLELRSVAQPLGPPQSLWGWIQKHRNKQQQVGTITSLMLNRKVAALDLSGVMDPLRPMESTVSVPSFSTTWHIT